MLECSSLQSPFLALEIFVVILGIKSRHLVYLEMHEFKSQQISLPVAAPRVLLGLLTLMSWFLGGIGKAWNQKSHFRIPSSVDCSKFVRRHYWLALVLMLSCLCR